MFHSIILCYKLIIDWFLVTILPNSLKLRISYVESDYKPYLGIMNGAFYKFHLIDIDLQMTIKNQLQTKFGRERLMIKIP